MLTKIFVNNLYADSFFVTFVKPEMLTFFERQLTFSMCALSFVNILVFPLSLT